MHQQFWKVPLMLAMAGCQFATDRSEFIARPPFGSPPSSPPTATVPNGNRTVRTDCANFYARESLLWFTAGFGLGSVMANTSIDSRLHDRFQSNVRVAHSDDLFEMLHAQKEWGNGFYTVPILAAAWAVGKTFEGNLLADVTGEWGERSIRGYLVGVPPMLAMQYVTGASLPGETGSNSMWNPFHDTNGVSGHSFMGALPFITAAKMTDRPLWKLALYGGSAIAPLSRVNDGAHYPSQVMLGWTMAFVAAAAVDRTKSANDMPFLFPIVNGDAVGMGVEFRR